MFKGLITDAKTAVGSVVTKFAARASVAIPFLIALGFATAGVTLLLIDQYGQRNAYFLVAGGYALIGLLAAVLVRSKEQEDAVSDGKASIESANSMSSAVSSVATETVAAAAEQLPLSLISSLVGSYATQETLIAGVKGLGRNMPLVLLAGFLGLLLSPHISQANPEASSGDDLRKRTNPTPNGYSHPEGFGGSF